MATGLIGTGLQYRQQAETLASQTDKLAMARKEEEQRMKEGRKMKQASLGATGALIGWEAGAAAGGVTGPWGAVIGAGIGLLAGSLF